MRILVTNDDGITAIGIIKLAAMAKELGEVTVIAPDNQCSAMSQKLTILTALKFKEVKDFPVEGVKAYTVSGTPADCVRIGVDVIMADNRPDIVFSGVNSGYNTGYDIAYSGTIGAASEALIAGIPAIAYSTDFHGIFGTLDKYMLSVTKEVLEKPIALNEIWNLNFPGCEAAECKGILWDRIIAQDDYYNNVYVEQESDDPLERSFTIHADPIEYSLPGTDIDAIKNNCISVGKVVSTVITANSADRITYRGKLVK